MSHKQKHKLWLINKNRKILKKRTKKNKKIKKRNKSNFNRYLSHLKSTNRNIEKYKVRFPSKFSIIYNYEETINCFNEIIRALSSKRRNISIFFDLQDVSFITNDAIMYTIALIKNIKGRSGFNYNCGGNTPKNKKAREILEQSGFFKYVNSNKSEFTLDNNIVMIKTGNNSDGPVAGEICVFTQNKLNIDQNHKHVLYETLIELMSNTYFHAYNKDDENEIFEKVWYVYSEFHDDKVKYIFLDVGVGLAATIHKKLSEKFKDTFGKKIYDCEYIESTFTGIISRTKTKLPYRGNGLPHIYTFCQNNILKNFSVFSGCAQCDFKGDNIISKNHKQPLIGTLYYWELSAKENIYDNNYN